MKNIYKFMLLGGMLLFTFVVSGQEYFKPVKTNAGIHNISFGGFETSDGGYLIGFYAYSETLKKHGILSKYDINGNLLWSKVLLEFNPDGITELSDGSIIICGGKVTNDGIIEMFQNMYIVKLNPCGEVEWAKIDQAWDDIPNDYLKTFALRTLIDVGDGVILPIRCAGGIFPDGFHRIDLVKIDYDGNVVFRNSIYADRPANLKEIWNGEMDNEGNIWLSGTTTADNPFSTIYAYPSPLIIKCDLEGNLLRSMTADDLGVDVFGDSFYNVPPLIDDNGDVFFGTTDSFIPLNSRDIELCSSIIKVDKEEQATTYKFTNPDVPYEDYRRTLNGWAFINDKQNIVTTMNYWDDDEMEKRKDGDKQFRVKHFSNDSEADFVMPEMGVRDAKVDNEDDYQYFMNRLYVLDKEANVVDSLELNDYFTLGERTEYLFNTQNNDIILVTNTRLATPTNGKTNDNYIWKFTSELKPALIDHSEREYDVHCDRAIVSETLHITYEQLYKPNSVEGIFREVKALRISPNPASGVAKIYLSEGFGEKSIDIYDGVGRVVKSVTIGKSWAYEELDISDLKSGIYIVKLTVNGKQMATEKLVVK